jgi:hypothetical protein
MKTLLKIGFHFFLRTQTLVLIKFVFTYCLVNIVILFAFYNLVFFFLWNALNGIDLIKI